MPGTTHGRLADQPSILTAPRGDATKNGDSDLGSDSEVMDSLAPAADGLIRLREHPDDDPGQWQQRSRERESVRFPQESLHSFRFSSSSSSSNNHDLVELRKSLMNRSLDFMKHAAFNHSDTLPGHYSPSALLTHSLVDTRTKTKSVDYSPVSSFKLDHYKAARRRRRSNPMPGIQESSSSSSLPGTPADESDLKKQPLSSSSTSSSRPLTPDDTDDVTPSSSSTLSSTSTNQRKPSHMLFPHPALHNPSRFLPQNQAILTTYDDWRVILSNDVAGLVLVGTGGSCRGLVGTCVIDFIEPTYRSRFLDMVMRRRDELGRSDENTGGMVLICGNVLPIVKQDGTRSAASLWLKEKRNDAGSSVYIWIFEEVFETVIHVSVDMDGTIHYVDDAVQDLYGYRPDELIGAPIDTLIPSLAKDKRTGWQDVNRLRSFGSKTKLGAHFPIIAKIHTVTPPPPPPTLPNNTTACNDAPNHQPRFTLRITSIPMIAGLVTIRRTGIIDGCNAAFAGYMFGLSQEELVKKDIAELVPQFPRLLHCLQRDDLLQHGIIINNLICRKLVADDKSVEKYLDGKPRRLTQAPNGQSLPVLIAIHRDQTPIEVQLQLKLVEGSDDVCALWITYDREATFARVGHSQPATTPLELKQHNGLGLPAARRPIPSDPEHDTKDKPSSTAQRSLAEKKKQQQHQEAEQYSSSPPPMRIITSFTRPDFSSQHQPPPSSPVSPSTPITVRSATLEHKRSSLQHQVMPATPPALVYSAQTNATSIDDFEILENLGQGAYGLVKVAVRKGDPERRKVVIKYVIKSRILVDCWIKDRKLGVIPVEIHILHTLRKIPHKNCSDMLDYFEDDDHYYIVMGLHGAGMDLFDYIELKEGMADKEIQSIFRQIAEAVQHLHEHKIVHRDIKDENVVLDQDGGVRLIDFGSAAYLKGRRYDTFVGTLDYAAPEILAGKTYEGPPQDIWALGILLYTLVYRENPFYDIDEILGHELRVPFVLSEGSLDLIRKMLDRNEDKRLTIQEVLAHPWLNQE